MDDALFEIIGFDVDGVAELVKAHTFDLVKRVADSDPEELADLRDEVYEFWAFAARTWKAAKFTQDKMDEVIKSALANGIVEADSIELVRNPQVRNGAGRKPMTPEQKHEAAKKRALEALEDMDF